MMSKPMPPAPPEPPTPPEGGSANTLTVSSDVLPEVKPGDVLTVKSVADGNVTLEHQSQSAEEGDENWDEGLVKAAPRDSGEGM